MGARPSSDAAVVAMAARALLSSRRRRSSARSAQVSSSSRRSGVWKWRSMATSKTGQAHKYVDTAHRAALMYSFAALLLGHFATLNGFTERRNLFACAAPLAFFAFAIGTYLLHGWLEDTSNQISKARLGSWMLPAWMTPLFMAALTAAVLPRLVGSACCWGASFRLRICKCRRAL